MNLCDLTSLEIIRERLALPQPLRLGELAGMAGVSRPTLRKLIADGALVTVSSGLKKEHRVPVQEAKRLLTELRIL